TLRCFHVAARPWHPRTMSVVMRTPRVDELPALLRTLAGWQREGLPVPLHPGDVAWFQRFGADATAAALRVWEQGGSARAIGLLDGPTLLRLGLDLDAADDDELAGVMARDIQSLPEVTDVEAGLARHVRSRLAEAGWADGEPFTPLARDLTEPVDTGGFDIRIIGPDQAHERAAVQRAAFPGSTFTVERWHAMAAGPGYADGRCVVVYDGDTAAAAATVWSAGPGRPGLLEPV